MAQPSSGISYEPIDPSTPNAPETAGLQTPTYYDSPARGSSASLGGRNDGTGSEKALNPEYAPQPSKPSNRKRNLIIAGVAALLLLILVIVLPVYFAVIKPKQRDGTTSSSGGQSNGGNHGNGNNNGGGHTTSDGVTGADGSIVTKEDGTTFTYTNKLGGFWVDDPQNPLNESARCNDYTPPLSEQWRYGIDRMRGVNIGGWLNLEPFMSPALYERFYPNAVDEWTLSEHLMAADGDLHVIEDHYKTFITEEDFARIAGAGLNWVRLPIAFWAIEKYPGEPFLERVSWTYFLKAIKWARKYGLRINLDLHALPGSQNAWNHSGKMGQINFLNGVAGIINAQRSLDYIRILAEFISQPEIKNVVPFFGIANEPRVGEIPRAALENFYAEAYRIIREVGGTGAGNGPWISIHEGFVDGGIQSWVGFLQGADRLALDIHPYFAFGPPSAAPLSDFIIQPCARWGPMLTNSLTGFGLTGAGEFSNAINDCGLYLNAVGRGAHYDGTYDPAAPETPVGSCERWNNYEAWDQQTKDDLRAFMMSSMDSLRNYFFWNWKIAPSSATGKVMTPFWSYSLGLENGWVPTDPTTADGQCERLGSPFPAFDGPLQPWQAGGAGAGVVPTATQYTWPPPAVGGFADAAGLPRYTPTGPIVTMPAATVNIPGSDTPFVIGDGWFNDSDTVGMSVPVPGCDYPADPWNAETAPVPAWCAALGPAPPPAVPAPVPVVPAPVVPVPVPTAPAVPDPAVADPAYDPAPVAP